MSSVAEERLGISAAVDKKIELRPNSSEDDLQVLFQAAYEQVFGREGVYAREMFVSAESFLRQGTINVRQFIELLAQSEFYQERFFHNNSQIRFIELNYKHLLGRAVYDQSEIAYHVDLYASQGYEAEIKSYLYSREYDEAFGDYVVPHYRGFQSTAGMKTVGYNRMFEMYRGNGNSDNAQLGRKNSRLRDRVSMNMTNWIRLPVSPTNRSLEDVGGQTLRGAVRPDGNRVYRIEVLQGPVNSKAPVRRSRQTYIVPFAQFSSKFQEIHRRGGKIISIVAT